MALFVFILGLPCKNIVIALFEACAKKHCALGKECVIDEETDEPICVCAKACPSESNPRAMVGMRDA